MQQTILVRARYHGPTNYHGTRISVTRIGGNGNRSIVHRAYNLDYTEDVTRAVVESVLKWTCWNSTAKLATSAEVVNVFDAPGADTYATVLIESTAPWA